MDNMETVITPDMPVEIGAEAVEAGIETFDAGFDAIEGVEEASGTEDLLDLAGPEINGEELETEETVDSSEDEQIERVREELENERTDDEVEDIDSNNSLEDQIRLLDETIAILKIELEDLKKLRGSVFLNALKSAIKYFIKDTFSEEPQEMEKDPQREYINNKITTLEKDIARLTQVRDLLETRLSNSI